VLPEVHRQSPFVGRRRELPELLAHLDAARQGSGSVVLVSGEPGVGKTRLLAELAHHARADGWRVIEGRAYETEGMPPYLPWTEALRAHVRACSPEELSVQLGAGAAHIALLVPDITDGRAGSFRHAAPPPDHERYQLFESVVHLLQALGRSLSPRSGLLVVLDDLHWADAPTLHLLLHLARRLTDTPILLAGAYRDTDLTVAHPLSGAVANLRREHLSHELALGAWSADDVASLIEAVAGRTPPAFAQAVHRETEGNPFFVEEVLRHLRAHDYDLTDPRTASGGWGLPQGVRQVVGQRLARLSPEAHRLLQIGAVLGDRWDIELLTSVSEFAFESLVAALDEATGAQLIREEGNGYQFTHALVRRSVYDGQSLPFRQRFHLRAARAIEGAAAGNLTPAVTVLAAHYQRAGAGSVAQAADYTARAALVARSVYGWEEEAAHWQAALDLAARAGEADPARQCELLQALGGALVRSGEHGRGHDAFREAAALARPVGLGDALARAVLAQVEELSRVGFRANSAAGPPEDPIALLEEGLRALGPEDSALRARLLARLAQELYMRGEERRSADLSHAAIATARGLGVAATLASVLHTVHKALWAAEQLPLRLQLTEEMLALADASGEPHLAVSAWNARIPDLMAVGDGEALNVAMATYARLVEELRQAPLHVHAVAVQRAMRCLLSGDLAEAEQQIHEARAVGLQVQCPDTNGCYDGQMFQLRRFQGRLKELDTAQQRAGAEAPHTWLLCAGRAQRASEAGDAAEARREFEHAAVDGFAAVPRVVTWQLGLTPITRLADVCVFLGDADRAALLYERLLPYAEQGAVGGWAVVYTGSVARTLGQLAAVMGDSAAATAHFEAALALETRMGARPWLAHTQRQYAQVLAARRGRGHRRHARQLLGAALAHYSDMGMDHFAAQTRTFLAEPALAGLPPPPTRFPAGLTAREVDVLRLIAAGKSNRDIGEALTLSVRTVGRHVANIYVKIGAHNKADATAYALRHGLSSLVVQR
jgi:DNA-binding CsgD family transcriptional regulator